MARKAGSADLPLHSGHVPKWLADRMTRLGTVISEAIIHHYGVSGTPPHRVSAGAAAGGGLAYATATLSFSLILFKPGNCNELKKPPLGDPR